MTLEQIYTLEEVIEEALKATDSASTPEVRHWILTNRRKVVEDNWQTIQNPGLDYWIRQYRKKRNSPEAVVSIHQLCFAFGIEDLDLDDEISIPEDEDDIYGACDWNLLRDATVPQLDMHIRYREAQLRQDQIKLENYRLFRQVVARADRGRGWTVAQLVHELTCSH